MPFLGPGNGALRLVYLQAQSPFDERLDARAREAGRRHWPDAPLEESFLGNVKRLHTFGYEKIAEELLASPSFATAESLAFNLANYLCRPYTDALGRFSCESGRRLTQLRERLKSHYQPIDPNLGHSDFFLDKIADGDPPITDASKLEPGMTFVGPTFKVQLAAAELWELLNGLILPMRTGISIHSRRIIGDPLAAAEQVLSYPHRRESNRYFQEIADLMQTGDLQGAEVALREVARLNELFEESSGVKRSPIVRHVVRYTALGLKKSLSYVPLVGGLLSDLAELGGTVVKDYSPAVLEKLAERITSHFDKWLPNKGTREQFFPMLTWSQRE